ncbi:hypothetical protein KIKIMORA_01930 [Brevundimonas phage vB_BpoS-Kikimora]|uniref:Uncharacterized protein n=1 Tax=Brevundimonas phage vB_BpoS-Kikimora TaxID=2948601 RepID=A0A9E7SLA7_9CAUD|nr:hypothetical protein KIKIMORA_01930 [Brevundimonas phage vB_BpoS-Kikimora]
MAQHYLLSAASRTMSIFDAADMGRDAFSIFEFAIEPYGRHAAALARSTSTPIEDAKALIERMRRIMMRQNGDLVASPTAKARHTTMMRMTYVDEDPSELTWAEAIWRDANRRVDTKALFDLIWEGETA